MVNTASRYEHILGLVHGSPWAITQEYFNIICAIVGRKVSGIQLSAEEIQQEIGAAPLRQPAPARTGAVAVIPLHGPIAQRMNLMSDISGGTSSQQFESMFIQAIADPNVSSVVLDIDSPGGSVFGIQEAWNTVMSRRGQKPVVAVANSMAASAAYWIASAADSISVTPSGSVGSIGVIAEHQDISGALERDGVRTTLISAGKNKVAGNPYEPLADDARAAMQAKVNTYYSMFTNSVAQGRSTNASAVRNGFGEGDMVLAQEAVRLGMADRIETLDQTIGRMMGQGQRNGARAELLIAQVSEQIDAMEPRWFPEPVPDPTPEPEPEPVPANALLLERRLKMLG